MYLPILFIKRLAPFQEWARSEIPFLCIKILVAYLSGYPAPNEKTEIDKDVQFHNPSNTTKENWSFVQKQRGSVSLRMHTSCVLCFFILWWLPGFSRDAIYRHYKWPPNKPFVHFWHLSEAQRFMPCHLISTNCPDVKEKKVPFWPHKGRIVLPNYAET